MVVKKKKLNAHHHQERELHRCCSGDQETVDTRYILLFSYACDIAFLSLTCFFLQAFGLWRCCCLLFVVDLAVIRREEDHDAGKLLPQHQQQHRFDSVHGISMFAGESTRWCYILFSIVDVLACR